MQLEWYGQSAFRLTDGVQTVFIDPFGDMGTLHARGMRWDYPAITGVTADLLLVTHATVRSWSCRRHRDAPVRVRGAEPPVEMAPRRR